MARKELTGRCFIEINGAPPVPFDSLSAEEKAKVMEIWSERLSKTMSAYYTNHPEEYSKI